MDMEKLERNLADIRSRIANACGRARREPASVTLIAVTKTVAPVVVRGLYDLGVRDFAENRPQELWRKAPLLPADCRWALIGQLQTNKLRRTLPMIASLHSLDRFSLAEALSAECDRLGRTVPAFIELNLTDETAKHGFRRHEIADAYSRLLALPSLQIVGVMGMARYEDDAENCRATFAELRTIRDALRAAHRDGPALPNLSMGMSGDFEVAIEEGATHVRVGSALLEGVVA